MPFDLLQEVAIGCIQAMEENASWNILTNGNVIKNYIFIHGSFEKYVKNYVIFSFQHDSAAQH